MSFANLKKASKNSFTALAEKMVSEKKGGFSEDDRYWQPDVDKAGNGFAVVRFLPAPDGEDAPYVKMFSHGFKIGTRWYIENCGTTVGGKCPACESNNLKWETGLKSEQDEVRTRKRRQQYISNVLVISDSKNPDNEGKVFLYKYGLKIFEKIMSAIKPEFEDETPFNPFDFWEGANFKIKIRQVEGYRNYDRSEFDEPSVLLDGDDNALEGLWKQEYSLKELISAAQFKPYDELKKKLNLVLGAENDLEEAIKKDSSGDIAFESEPPKSVAKKPAVTAAKKPAVDEDEDSADSDLALYARLLADD